MLTQLPTASDILFTVLFSCLSVDWVSPSLVIINSEVNFSEPSLLPFGKFLRGRDA